MVYNVGKGERGVRASSMDTRVIRQPNYQLPGRRGDGGGLNITCIEMRMIHVSKSAFHKGDKLNYPTLTDTVVSCSFDENVTTEKQQILR